MTALHFARTHAATVEALESCAPPVCAPYLQAAYDRMKLPISVEYRDYNHQQRRNGARDHFELSWPGNNRTLYMFRDTAEASSRAYFNLCESLLNPATSSPAGNLGGCSANSSTPEGVGL